MKQVDYFTFFYRILHPPHTTFLYIYLEGYHCICIKNKTYELFEDNYNHM